MSGPKAYVYGVESAPRCICLVILLYPLGLHLTLLYRNMCTNHGLEQKQKRPLSLRLPPPWRHLSGHTVNFVMHRKPSVIRLYSLSGPAPTVVSQPYRNVWRIVYHVLKYTHKRRLLEDNAVEASIESYSHAR